MATRNIPSQNTSQVANQIKLSKRLGSEKILSTKEAEATVKEWAANMNRCLSEAELKCLADYMRNNCEAQVEDFDKVLFGWYRRGENETENVANLMQGLLCRFENTQTKIVSLVEKAMNNAPPYSAPTSIAAAEPGSSRSRKWPPSLGPSEHEFGVLSRYLDSKTSKESMRIKDIFEELIAIQKLNTTKRFLYTGAIGDLGKFLSHCAISIDELIRFTPKGKTTEVMEKFAEEVSRCDGRLGDPVHLIARLSVYLSYFNQGK